MAGAIVFRMRCQCILLKSEGRTSKDVGSITGMCNVSVTKEIQFIKKQYQGKTCLGVVDGAAYNWKFLQPFVDEYVSDYFHAIEYLAKVSKAAFKRKFEGKEWLKQSCHVLKHELNGADIPLKEMKNLLNKKISKEKKDEINTAITYFTNHLAQMDYSCYIRSFSNNNLKSAQYFHTIPDTLHRINTHCQFIFSLFHPEQPRIFLYLF